MSELLDPTQDEAPATRTPAAPAARPVRVASVPAGHPYVAGVTAAEGVEVLPDPVPPGAEPGRWWPPVVLDPRWVRTHADDADLLHVHFGTESSSPGHLAATLDAAHAAGWPVVLTVHDLEHPQLTDQAPYRAQLDTLVRGADAVVTLTPGAADEVRARWSRDAVVLGHPRLLAADVPVDLLHAADRPDGALLVGLHLKDIRPNVDAVGATRRVVGAVAALAAAGTPARAEVRLHREVRDPAARDAVRALCAGSSLVTLVEHDRLDDRELARSLARVDACVLPYTHGTHSGWLELCWDLGVPVVAPAVGYYAEQHPDGSVVTCRPERAGDPDGTALAEALRALDGADGTTRAGTPERAALVRARRAARASRDGAVAAAHADLYRRLLAEIAR
ncbi:glycosyltransferase [Cellulomonas sp. Marseille-Q8402]